MLGMKTNDDSHLKGATCLSMENALGLVLDKTQQSLCPKTQGQLWDMQTKRDQLWDVKPSVVRCCVWEDWRMSVQLSPEQLTMCDCVSSLGAPMVTNDRHVPSEQ